MNLKKIIYRFTGLINNNYLNFIFLTILFISAQTLLSPVLGFFLSDEIKLSQDSILKDFFISKRLILIYIFVIFPILFVYYFFYNYNFKFLKNNYSYLNIFRASLVIFIAIIILKFFKFFINDNLSFFYLIKSHYFYIFLFSSSYLMYLKSYKKIYLLISMLLFIQFVFLSNGNRANLITILFIFLYFNTKFLNKHFLLNIITVILFFIFVLPINYSLKCRGVNGECFKNIFYDMSYFINIYEDQYNRCLSDQRGNCYPKIIGQVYSDATVARVVQLHNINKILYTDNAEFKTKFQNKENIIKETLIINPFAKKIFNLSETVQLTGNEIGRMLKIIDYRNYTTGISIPTYIDLHEKFGLYSLIIFSSTVSLFFIILNNCQNHNLLFFLSPFFFIKTLHSMENYSISFLSNLINLLFYFSIFYLIIFLLKKFYKYE